MALTRSTPPSAGMPPLPLFRGMMVFGDSLSDIGNVLYGTTFIQPFEGLLGVDVPLGPAPPYSNGRFSDGPVWVDYLSERLGFSLRKSTDLSVFFPPLPLPSPATLTATGPDFSPYFNGATINNDVNFAFGGARTGFRPPLDLTDFDDPADVIPGLLDQVAWFLADRFLYGTPPDPETLHVVWAGPNDYWGNPDPDPLAAVVNIGLAVLGLYLGGARQFLVPNLPDLSLTPRGIQAGQEVRQRLQQASLAHNSLLAGVIKELNTSLPDARIHAMDVYDNYLDLLSNPVAFGYTNVTQACFDEATGIVCGDPGTYLSWDSIHPTSKAHEQISFLALEALGYGSSDVTAPLAKIDPLPIRRAGQTEYGLTVHFQDDYAIERVLLDNADVRIDGPQGFFRLATLTSVEGNDPADLKATYTVEAPAIFWNLADAGSYTVSLAAGSVADRAGNAVSGSILGSFDVTIQGRTIEGTRLNDFRAGGRGDDLLLLGAGDDIGRGRAGHDGLEGGAGRDRLYGDLGDDWLFGGSGADVLSGGRGADRFAYRSAAESRVGSMDRILDFDAAEGDRLWVADRVTGMHWAGAVRAASLATALERLYRDRDPVDAGFQPLGMGEALGLEWNGRIFLSFNTGELGFGRNEDLVVEMKHPLFAGGVIPEIGIVEPGLYWA